MRILKMLICTLPLAWAFAGCSEDGMIPDSGPETGKVREVEITLNLGVDAGLQLSSRSADACSGMVQTRADGEGEPRELTTIDDAQQVNDVRIYVFHSTTQEGPYTFYIPEDLKAEGKVYYSVPEFDNEEPYYSQEGLYGTDNNVFEEHTVVLKPRLEVDGYYKFLAVGRDDKYATPISTQTANQWGNKVLKDIDFTEGTTTFQDADVMVSIIERTSGTFYNPLWCTELFSGILEGDKAIHIDEKNSGFNETIELKRAVAGLMMYVKNIPYQVEDNVEFSGVEFTPTTLTIQMKCVSTSVGLVSRSDVDKNTTRTSGITLATIPLRTWSNNGTIFTRPAENGLVENSAMSSNYLMPIDLDNINGDVTFYLVYGATDDYTGDSYKRMVKIKLENDGEYKFPIVANRLYALGQKGHDKNGDEFDDPYDLTPTKEGNEVVITVHPNWEGITEIPLE